MLLSRLPLVLLLIISSCQKSEFHHSGKALPNTGIDKLQLEDNLERLEKVTYLAVLTSVNGAVAGEAYGSFTFHKDQDFIVADMRLNDSGAVATQIQKVHLGKACPTEADDTNQDGYIDVIESGDVTGKVIIPLDNDISSQYGLLGSYPITDAWGSYVYSKTASFSQFYQDLFAEDLNPEDEVVKLTSPLGLIGKTVVVYGMEENFDLPETVATNNNLPAYQTLPIACGVITLVTDIPGTFEPDDITIGHVPAPPTPRVPGRNGPGNGPSSGNGTNSPNPEPNFPDDEPSDPYEGRECSGTSGKDCSEN
jgi:hypothetical protein